MSKANSQPFHRTGQLGNQMPDMARAGLKLRPDWKNAPFTNRQEVPERRHQPNLFLVGAPKCGTTAMAQYLGSHPEVFMGRKEMHHFGSDLWFAPHFYRRKREAYLTEYEGGKGQQWLGDASVWYLFSSQAAKEIKDFNPDARIIIMLREPVEMMYSLFHQFRFDGNEELAKFEDALTAEGDRRNGRCIGRRAYLAQGLGYRDVARYAGQVERYFEVFGRERVKVIVFDDFAADPAKTYAETLDFLDLGAAQTGIDFKVVGGNASPKHSVLSAILADPWLRSCVLSVRPWMPRAVFGCAQRLQERLRRSNTRFEKRPPLAPELCRQLKVEFAAEVQRLGRLLGRDLTHWSR